MNTRLLFLALSLAAPALAQSKPTLIDYPLDVKAPIPEAKQTELQNDFRQLLARNPAVLLSTRSHWKASVSALKREDCEIRDECLQQLATTAGTLYAIYASVQQNAAGTEVTATGRVVNQDRQEARARMIFTVPRKGAFNDAARDALGKLVKGLELEKLSAVLTPPAPVTAVVPVPAPVAEVKVEPPPPPLPPQDLVLVVPALPPEPKAAPGASPARIAGWAIGGLGVVAAGFAVGFGVSAAVARGTLPADGRFLDDGQARTQSAVNRDATVSLGSSLAAAALLGTATVLFIASTPPSTPTITLAPAPGGAQLTLSGEFGP